MRDFVVYTQNGDVYGLSGRYSVVGSQGRMKKKANGKGTIDDVYQALSQEMVIDGVKIF